MTKLLLFVVLLIPSITYAASFDCNKAHSDVEKLIVIHLNYLKQMTNYMLITYR